MTSGRTVEEGVPLANGAYATPIPLGILHDKAEYRYLARRFIEEMDSYGYGPGRSERSDAQFEVVQEEFEEFEEAYESGSDGELAEEVADCLVTLFVISEMMELDISEAYERKMEYNLEKTGERDMSGKIVDNAEIEKPSFRGLYGHSNDS